MSILIHALTSALIEFYYALYGQLRPLLSTEPTTCQTFKVAYPIFWSPVLRKGRDELNEAQKGFTNLVPDMPDTC